MPGQLHHVTCVTREAGALVGYLTSVVGLDVVEHNVSPGELTAAFVGWPETESLESWMLGAGNAGLLEVVALPEDLWGRVPEGIRLLGFGTRDLDGIVAGSDGLPMRGPIEYTIGSHDLCGLAVEVGGVTVDFFARRSPGV